MRINCSIRTAVLSGTTQLLNFPPGLQVIMRMCNDPETGANACLEDKHDSSPQKDHTTLELPARATSMNLTQFSQFLEINVDFF